MKRISLISAVVCCATLPAPADMTPQPQASLIQGSSTDWSLDWDGVEQRTYFTQWSLDLVTWNYSPNIEYGSNVNHTCFTASSPKFFVRLCYTDVPTSDPELADYDFDGLGNLFELTLGTDPLAADSDHDGLIDGVEIAKGSNPLSDTDGDLLRAVDSDGDGVSDAVELLHGTSPTLRDSDGDGFGDGEDVFPLDPSLHALPTSRSGDGTKPTVTLDAPTNAILVAGP